MTRLEARLADLAARGETITYGALARELDMRMAALTMALEALMAQDSAQSKPLRAALCEAKLAHGQPAKGFFDAAAALGHDISDPIAFVADQRRRLFAG
ncbi:MAG: hypothetical protein ACOH2M_32160 [Cypionkella sp.]